MSKISFPGGHRASQDWNPGLLPPSLGLFPLRKAVGSERFPLYAPAPAQTLVSKWKGGRLICAGRERMVPSSIPHRQPFSWGSPAFVTWPIQPGLVTLAHFSTSLTSGFSLVKLTS